MFFFPAAAIRARQEQEEPPQSKTRKASAPPWYYYILSFLLGLHEGARLAQTMRTTLTHGITDPTVSNKDGEFFFLGGGATRVYIANDHVARPCRVQSIGARSPFFAKTFFPPLSAIDNNEGRGATGLIW